MAQRERAHERPSDELFEAQREKKTVCLEHVISAQSSLMKLRHLFDAGASEGWQPQLRQIFQDFSKIDEDRIFSHYQVICRLCSFVNKYFAANRKLEEACSNRSNESNETERNSFEVMIAERDELRTTFVREFDSTIEFTAYPAILTSVQAQVQRMLKCMENVEAMQLDVYRSIHGNDFGHASSPSQPTQVCSSEDDGRVAGQSQDTHQTSTNNACTIAPEAELARVVQQAPRIRKTCERINNLMDKWFASVDIRSVGEKLQRKLDNVWANIRDIASNRGCTVEDVAKLSALFIEVSTEIDGCRDQFTATNVFEAFPFKQVVPACSEVQDFLLLWRRAGSVDSISGMMRFLKEKRDEFNGLSPPQCEAMETRKKEYNDLLNKKDIAKAKLEIAKRSDQQHMINAQEDFDQCVRQVQIKCRELDAERSHIIWLLIHHYPEFREGSLLEVLDLKDVDECEIDISIYQQLEFYEEQEWPPETQPLSSGYTTVKLYKTKEGEQCILKGRIISSGRSSGSRARRAFLREYNILKSLYHPNVIQIQKVFLARTQSSLQGFLEFPYYAGGTLEHWIKNEAHRATTLHNGHLIDRSEINAKMYCLYPLLQAVQGLHYLHGLGIVHGDMKLANILMTVDGRAVLADFEYARESKNATPSGVATTRAGAGTPSFMAPEIITGNSATLESDIFSFGCCCFRILAPKAELSAINGQVNMEIIECLRMNFENELKTIGDLGDQELASFLRSLCDFDPGQRLKAGQVMVHEVFASVTTPEMLTSMEDYRRYKCTLLPSTRMDRIDAVKGENIKFEVRKKLNQSPDCYFPRIIISYATGHRENLDHEGMGPGVVNASVLIDALKRRGIDTYSGLHVQSGEYWKTEFFKRLKKAQILLALLTPAFYKSNNVLKEVYAALDNGLKVIPIYFEGPIPAEKDCWPIDEHKINKDKPNLSKMRQKVIEEFLGFNAVPSPETECKAITANPQFLNIVVNDVVKILSLASSRNKGSSSSSTQPKEGIPLEEQDEATET